MREYEVLLKSGRRITVTGGIHLFNDNTSMLLNSQCNSFNASEVAAIEQKQERSWTTEELINELGSRDEVHFVDPAEDAYTVQLDLTNEKTKPYTIIKNNYDANRPVKQNGYHVYGMPPHF